jgi:N-formylglutamate deformylase
MTFSLHRGDCALLVSMPHIGTEIPAELRADYQPRALDVEDTDWHLDRLYDFLSAMGASVLQPRTSRYVIDLNRPPDDAPMYPGASNTELCPTHFFTGDDLYLPGGAPDPQERQRRRDVYWRPYHAALASELQRIKAIHGYVMLWDAHSIRSCIPWLFEGTLPGLNLGTANGESAHPSIGVALEQVCQASPQFSHVLNGRFKGGHITRQYGSPKDHVHAVQLEMCQHLYMDETSPFAYDEHKAKAIQPLLQSMMTRAFAACQALYEK